MVTGIMGTALLLVAGLVWGVREYSHKNPKWAEVLYNVSPTGFFGSRQDLRKYKDFDPSKGGAYFLSHIFPVNDFWHSSKYLLNFLWAVGIILCFLQSDNILQVMWQRISLVSGWVIFVQAFWAWAAFTFIDRKIARI